MYYRFWRAALRLLTIAAAATALLTLPGLQATTGPHAVTAQERGTDAREVLLAQATKAVNARQIEAMTPLTAPGAIGTFAWAPEAHETWEGALLTPPTPAPNETARLSAAAVTLAVFHAWHSCQSDGDHVHRLLHTPEGWRLGAEIPETETLGFRIRDHDLHVTFDVPRKNTALSDTIQVERTAKSVPTLGEWSTNGRWPSIS